MMKRNKSKQVNSKIYVDIYIHIITPVRIYKRRKWSPNKAVSLYIVSFYNSKCPIITSVTCARLD